VLGSSKNEQLCVPGFVKKWYTANYWRFLCIIALRASVKIYSLQVDCVRLLGLPEVDCVVV
jgi:hypothetical protein